MSRVVLPVVHPVDRDTALRSIETVHAAGCKGVFLIDQGMTEPEVLRLVLEVRTAFPALWIGLNLLSRSPGTGHAADVAKVRAMRAGMGEAALALASGVTAENVATFKPYVDAYLVGTGVEASFGVIDRARLAALLPALA